MRSQEMQSQQVSSLKAAVAEAIAEKEATFEHLGEARERAAELQDALRDANSQIRLLRAEVAALHGELDVGIEDGDSGEGGIGERDQMESLLKATREELQTLKVSMVRYEDDTFGLKMTKRIKRARIRIRIHILKLLLFGLVGNDVV
jgi:chromosome segregation ATPase